MTTRQIKVETATGKFGQSVVCGPHLISADEPIEAGGDDKGPAPHEFLLIALGTCTSMTLKLYADRKGWPLEHVEVRVSGEKVDNVYAISREILVRGELDTEQRQRLLEIAEKCPVHKTLTGTITIASKIL